MWIFIVIMLTWIWISPGTGQPADPGPGNNPPEQSVCTDQWGNDVQC